MMLVIFSLELSWLQCVAVCCSVLWYVAECRSVLQCVAVLATHGNTHDPFIWAIECNILDSFMYAKYCNAHASFIRVT